MIDNQKVIRLQTLISDSLETPCGQNGYSFLYDQKYVGKAKLRPVPW